PARAGRSGFTCRTAMSGTSTSCGGWPNDRRTSSSSSGRWPAATERGAARTWDDRCMGETVAVLGAGKMGEALLSGMVRSGRPGSSLLFTERHPDRAAEIAERLGIESVDTVAAAERADTLLVAVKPQEIGALLDDLAPAVTPRNLVISIAAGIPT